MRQHSWDWEAAYEFWVCHDPSASPPRCCLDDFAHDVSHVFDDDGAPVPLDPGDAATPHSDYAIYQANPHFAQAPPAPPLGSFVYSCSSLPYSCYLWARVSTATRVVGSGVYCHSRVSTSPLLLSPIGLRAPPCTAYGLGWAHERPVRCCPDQGGRGLAASARADPSSGGRRCCSCACADRHHLVERQPGVHISSGRAAQGLARCVSAACARLWHCWFREDVADTFPQAAAG